MIRCLFYVEELNRGGIETFCMNVLRCADPERLEISFLVLKEGQYDFADEVQRLGASINYLLSLADLKKNRTRAGNLALQLRRMRQWSEVNAHNYDVLHFNASHLANAYPLIKAAQIGGFSKIVLHSHNSDDGNGLNKAIHKFIRPHVGSLSLAGRLACSEAAGEWMFGDGGGYDVISNGINLKQFEFRPEIRKSLRGALGISDDDVVFIYPARLTAPKNQSFLLEVIKTLKDEGKRVVLLLCGKGGDEDRLRQECARLGVSSCVKFLGLRDDVEGLMSASDCFLFPSLYEGLPIAAIEAQASGIPLVLSSGISSEAVLSDKTRILDLASGASEWARVGYALAETRFVPARYRREFYSFDIESTVSKLLEIYGGSSGHNGG